MNEQQTYYETMYILRPDIAEDEVTNHIDKYNKLLEEFGGTILDSQMRGKRRLAYQIAKHREGIYVQLSHHGDGQHIFKIEKAMRLSEDVIRYMTVKQEGPLPTPRSSTKSSTQADNKENPVTKVESKEKQPVVSVDTSTSGKDDTEKTIRKRINIYKETTQPLIQYFSDLSLLEYIDADRDLKTIATDIKQKIA